MASTVPSPRFVRCPRCLKVLAELPGIPLYKCGGCGAILRAKVHSDSGETLSLASVASSSKNISNTASLGKHTPATSDQPEGLEQERNFKEEFSKHGMKSSAVSELNGESGREKTEALVLEQIGIKGTPLQQDNDGVHPVPGNQLQEGIPTKAENILYQEGRKSFDQKISEANDGLKSSDKLEEFPESLERDITAEGDTLNGRFKNVTSFRLKSRSYHAYDGSVSSTDEERKDRVPQKYLLLSRRTFKNRKVENSDASVEEAREVMKSSVNAGAEPVNKKHSRMFSVESKTSATTSEVSSRSGVQAREPGTFTSEDFRSAQNWMESENDISMRSQSKDDTKFVKFRYTENGEQVNILRKVDELRDELIGFFHRTADGNGGSPFGTRSRQFEGKLPSKQYRSSLIPFPKQPNSSRLHCHPHEGICCHHSHRSPCPFKVCCHPPEGATSRHLHMESTSRPLHMESSPPLHREPQSRQSNDERPQTIKRLCRPVSGGAPFGICCRCYKLLQLPADFLVSAKRIHKLRCGGCSEVLKYSFRPRIHPMLPQTPAEAPHPPSEEENVVLDGITAPRGKDIAGGDPLSFSEKYEGITAPRGKDIAGGDPVSYTEEYELSFDKSYSYDAQPSGRLRKSYDGIVEEEINGREENRSRLHKLMGYSSARRLLFETICADDGHRIGQARYV